MILQRISRSGLDMIESRCDCNLDACVDTNPAHAEGYTIGFGHVGHDVKAGAHITQERAEEILREQDLPEFEGVVNRFYPISQSEFDDLVSAAFLLSRM